MSNESNKKLIYDFVDGQLSADQIQRAEELMAKHPELASLHEALCSQQVRLRSLPEYSLDDSFADQVVRKAQAEGLFTREPASESTVTTNVSSSATPAPKVTSSSSQPPNSFANWRSAAAAIVALAALLLVTLFIRPPTEPDSSSVAAKTESTKPESTTSEPPQLEPSGEKPGGAQPGEEQASKPESFSDGRRALPLEDLKNAAIQAVPSMNSPGGGVANVGGGLGGIQFKKNGVEADAMLQPQPEGAAAALRMSPKSRAVGKLRDEPGVDDPMVMADGLSVPGNTPSQILLVNLDRDDQSLELLEKTFRSNGLELNWSERRFHKSDGISELDDSELDMRPSPEPSELAFNVRTTPAKMMAMMVELNNRGDVIGIDSNEPSMMGADQLFTGQNYKSSQLRTMRLPRQQAAAKEVQPGQARSSIAEESVWSADEQPASQAVRELNQFFRLEADPAKEESQLAQAPLQSYTLVIRFQSSPELQSGARIGGVGGGQQQRELPSTPAVQPSAADAEATTLPADEAKPAKE